MGRFRKQRPVSFPDTHYASVMGCAHLFSGLDDEKVLLIPVDVHEPPDETIVAPQDSTRPTDPVGAPFRLRFVPFGVVEIEVHIRGGRVTMLPPLLHFHKIGGIVSAVLFRVFPEQFIMGFPARLGAGVDPSGAVPVGSGNRLQMLTVPLLRAKQKSDAVVPPHEYKPCVSRPDTRDAVRTEAVADQHGIVPPGNCVKRPLEFLPQQIGRHMEPLLKKVKIEGMGDHRREMAQFTPEHMTGDEMEFFQGHLPYRPVFRPSEAAHADYRRKRSRPASLP